MKTIVLFSAGLDSTTVLAMELALGHEILAITCDYGQSNKAEIERAKTLASYWGFPHKVIPVHLERSDARAEIPARNTVFLAKALEHALIEKADRVVYGAEPDATYTDSSLEYIEAMHKVFSLHGVALVAPIRQWKGKADVLAKALDLGVPLDLIHSSRTNRVDGGCKASARYLKTLHKMFPALNPITFLQYLSDAFAYTNQNPYDLRTATTGSFKWLPAFFALAAIAPVSGDKTLDVWTTGNWGKSMKIANDRLKVFEKIQIHITDKVEDLKQNNLNTDYIAAQWGMKQALSRLPRPQYMGGIGLSYRVTQGHLDMAVQSLGYVPNQEAGIPLITE